MGNYVDHRISARVSQQFRRVVTGKTDISPLANGHERRNAAWAFKKLKYSATFNLLTQAAQAEVVSAFYACQAQLYLFRFRDYGDCDVNASPFDTSAAVGTSDPVQLTKRYQFGSAYADRVIQAVSACVVKDHEGGDVAGTLDSAMGMFTPDASWGSGQYTWTGTFDVWVRFNSDELDVTMSTLDIASSDIELCEQVATNSGGG